MERLQDKRVWLGGGVVAALLLAAIGWFFFISPELSSADSARTQAAATRSSNALLQQKLDTLRRKSTQVSKYTAELSDALEALPVDSGLPAFTRQLTAQAQQNGVAVQSVVVGAFTSLASATPAAAPSTTAGDNNSAASDPSASTTAPATPTTAAGGLYSVQVTVGTTGALARQLAFLSQLRNQGPRRALINSTQLTPGVTSKEASIDGSSTMTTQLTVFSSPQSPAQIAHLKQLLAGKLGR